MTLPLTLLRSTRPAPAVSAGWLASPDPVEWLREIGHCLKQGCPVAAYPVAASPADPRPTGVFLVPRGEVPVFRARVQLLAELIPGVHAPRDAAMSAGLLANERGFFFPYAVHFFHPALGLTGFDAHDELAPAKLLEIPPERGARWNLAVPVLKFATEFRSITVSEPPGPEEMLAEAAGEIGDQAGKPDKGKGPLGTAADIGKGLAGGAVLGAGWVFGAMGKVYDFLSGARGLGRGGAKPPPLSRNRIEEWAEKNWKQLTDKRSREIERLMKLMETNPDEGLRIALPLTGTSQSRGVAPPSWSLGSRNTNFSHGHGGGAVDGWDIENDARLKLERQYREAAKREIALGRFERAAYIYGNLLGDWTSAAKALADAGRHRDAVSIYLHKLNNRPAAARCLEDGGLLLQAAAMYAECKQFEKAGDLQAQLGNEAAARELWLAEVEAQRDPIVKARILSEKLKDRAAALEILFTTWQSGNRPEVALTTIFTIYHEDGRPKEAVRLLGMMFDPAHGRLSLPSTLKLGHEQLAKWPEPELAAAFDKLAFQGIARELSRGNREASALLAFLPKLAPDDLLLGRDAKRFSIKASPPKIPVTGPPKGNLRPEQMVDLPKNARWHSIATIPKGVSLAGYGQDMLAVAQFRDNGCHSSALRTPDDPGEGFVDHLVVTSSRGSSRLFHFRKYRRLHYRALDRLRTPADDAIGTLREVIGIGPSGEDDFAVLQYTSTSSLTLHIYSEAAELRRSLPIDFAPPEVAAMDWHIAGRGGHFCFSAGTFFAWRYPDGQFALMNLSAPAAALHLSPLPSSHEVLISTAWEVLLLEIPRAGRSIETVNLHSDPTAEDPPVACYLPDGSVVIAWEGGGRIYPPDQRSKASGTLSFPTDAGVPVRVTSRGAGGFAILTDIGKLLVFPK